MLTSVFFNAIIDGVLSPSFPKHMEKPDYTSIPETHHLLTANTVSIKCSLRGGQNGYLGLVLTDVQYTLISAITFICFPNPGWTPSIPVWKSPI